MTARARTDALLLAGFCAFLFFYGLSQFGLIGADEPRYAQVAHEMLQRHDWITPTLGGKPWLEKPPLYYWQAMVAYSLFGVSDWAARVPSAVDATLLVLACYFFLRRFRPGYELDGALIAASCAGITGYARAASTDMPLSAAFGVGMLAWWAWRESQVKIYLAMFYAGMAFGTLAKGPVAPFLALLIIVVYAAVARDSRVVTTTFWLPGIVLFCAVTLPWFIAVQMCNPQFFREFILEHNLGRFSKNLYHHTEPFWYYVPVAMLAMLPWTAFALVAIFRNVRERWESRKSQTPPAVEARSHLGLFACCWLLAPIAFFSVSQSKLPGYLLPAIPAVAFLLVDYLRLHLESKDSQSAPLWLTIAHGVLASAPIVPALLIAYLIAAHRLPRGRPTLAAFAVAFVLCAGIVLTFMRHRGLKLLRFVTLIPVVLTVGAVLKLGSQSLDEKLSARPIAREIAAIEVRPLPLAVFHVRRELEYGLTFYRNHLTFNYDWGRVPQEEHLLVAPENSQSAITDRVAGRRVSYLGHYAPQHVDYFWVAAAPPGTH